MEIIGIGRKLHELLTDGLLTLCKSTVMSLASFERSFGLARGSLMVGMEETHFVNRCALYTGVRSGVSVMD